MKKLLKVIFEKKPSLPRYCSIWDVHTVFDYIKKMDVNISLKDLTLKLTILLAILTGQRCQTIHLLDIDNMQIIDNKCFFYVGDVVKQTTAQRHIKPIEFLKYESDDKLCVVKCIQQYLQKTADIRGNYKQLLISFTKPHKPVSKDTIARWIKLMLQRSNIDIQTYGAHSTRAASTSAACKQLSVNDILKSAGWTNEKTFAKFYHLNVQNNNFGKSVIESKHVE